MSDKSIMDDIKIDSICRECLEKEPNVGCCFYVQRMVGVCHGGDIKTIDVNGTKYKVKDGTYYNKDTPDHIVITCEYLRRNNMRVRLYYGDLKTGLEWGDTHCIFGTISRSSGRIQIPILIHNGRSTGGGSILTECIIRIRHANKKTNMNNQNIHIHPYYHRQADHEEFLRLGGLKMRISDRIHFGTKYHRGNVE
jgi:hypothetical protein